MVGEKNDRCNECVDYSLSARSCGHRSILKVRAVSLNVLLVASIHTDDLLVVKVAWRSANSK